MLLTIAAAVLVLGVLIFVHELGHFMAAKAVGVGVPRFSLGLGPVSPIRWRRGETEYVLSWVPFGGYVKMATAEEPEEGGLAALEGGDSEEQFPPGKLFENKPLWARIVVIVAGVTMNAVFAWLIYTMLAATYGKIEDPTTTIAQVDTAGLPEAARALASTPFGSRVVRINGDTMSSWDDITGAILDPRSAELRFDFAPPAPPVVTVPIPGANSEDRIRVAAALHRMWEARIAMVAPGRPAEKAGLQPQDLVVGANGDTVRYWEEFVRAIEGRAGDTVVLAVRRGDTVLHLPVVPAAEETSDPVTGKRVVGRIGVGQGLQPRRVRYGPLAAVAEGGRQTAEDAGKVWFAVKGLVTGQVSARELGGPILIGQLSGQFVRVGLDAFLRFIAFFSVNLAILNLLPVPVLDGGHLVFLIAEGIRRKPLSVKLRLRLSQFGMALLIAVMLLALTNDVRRWFGE
ncbi:MAG: RIP metalloprotease RseP [Gemmatimonadetes bacterium]|nr:RIP metalloprotease RseP [Gemmatimonadota bacterium]